ncbi:MAG: hypothetical protein ACOYYU_10160 [Chloroflexota bacterium]
MDIESHTFKPKYPFQTRLLFYGLPVIFFALLCGAGSLFVELPDTFWLLALVLAFLTSLAPFFVVREIRFLEEMVIRRHFLPDLFVSHTEFELVNPDSIQAGGRRIRMGPVANLEELRVMAQRWKATCILKEAQRGPLAPASLFPVRGYGMYASFWGFMFGVIVMLMAPAGLRLDPRWLLAGVFLLVYFLYIYVIPKVL